MGNYRLILNPHTGKLQKVLSDDYVKSVSGNIVTFKAGVATSGDLPGSGNSTGDARIVNDTHHLYVWNGSSWSDQGDILDIKWAAVEDKPGLGDLSGDLDDVGDGTTYARVKLSELASGQVKRLDDGTNEVSASDAKDAVDKKHSQNTDTELEALTANIQLNDKWISNDGDNEGIKVNNDGDVEIQGGNFLHDADGASSAIGWASATFSNNSAGNYKLAINSKSGYDSGIYFTEAGSNIWSLYKEGVDKALYAVRSGVGIALKIASDLGTTLYANLDMNSNRIVNVADPTSNQDAVTKNYVDEYPAELKNLVQAEIQQLENIGATAISAAQWGYLGDLDQSLAKDQAVQFTDVTVYTADKNKMYLEADGSNAIFHIYGLGATSKIEHRFYSDGNFKWAIGMTDSDIVGDGSEFFIGQTAGGGTPAILIKTDNHVGINIDNPVGLFHVHGGNPFFTQAGDSDIILWLETDRGVGNQWCGVGMKKSNDTLCLFNGNSLTNHLVIDNTGKVAIGDYSPDEQLDVRGKVKSEIAEDTSFVADEVLNTGIDGSYGILIVRESTGGITAVYRVENQTLTAISAHADFSTTKDNVGTYNVYWETDQFKVQNKKSGSGDVENVRVGFFGL